MFSIFDAFGYAVTTGLDSRDAAEAKAADILYDADTGTKLYVVERGAGRVSRLVRRDGGTDMLALD